jgi:hypothetical protein
LRKISLYFAGENFINEHENFPLILPEINFPLENEQVMTIANFLKDQDIESTE